jgi:hypothetical protein
MSDSESDSGSRASGTVTDFKDDRASEVTVPVTRTGAPPGHWQDARSEGCQVGPNLRLHMTRRFQLVTLLSTKFHSGSSSTTRAFVHILKVLVVECQC